MAACGRATCRNYIRYIAEFAKFLGRFPDSATAEDVRRFLAHLTESGERPPKLKCATSAMALRKGDEASPERRSQVEVGLVEHLDKGAAGMHTLDDVDAVEHRARAAVPFRQR